MHARRFLMPRLNMHDTRCISIAQCDCSIWKAQGVGPLHVRSSVSSLHAGPYDQMQRPLRQGRGVAMQPRSSGRDFDAGTVLVGNQV